MKNKIIFLISLFFIIIGAVVFYFYFYKKSPLISLPNNLNLYLKIPKQSVTSTNKGILEHLNYLKQNESELKIITATETISNISNNIKTLGSITKFDVVKLQAEDIVISEYIKVYEGGIMPKTKLYMPYDGYVSFVISRDDNVDLLISTDDNQRQIIIFGPLNVLCETSKENSANRYYCKNLKKGELIAEAKENLKNIDENIVFIINGLINYQDDINFLYENLPLVFKQ